MASNEVSSRWRVKITSLPASITQEQLSLLLQPHSLSVYIPKAQKTTSHYAWINGFDNEQDAKKFVLQNSQLTISNSPVKCIAVNAKEDDTNNHQQPLRGLMNIQPLTNITLTSTVPDQTIDNESPRQTPKPHQQHQHRNPRERRISHAAASIETTDVEYKRQPCSRANKGMCPYKDGECKYRHTKCQNYDSCSKSDCQLAHACRSSSVCRSQSSSCPSGIECFKADCTYEHPEGWSACPDRAQCTNYECISNHPPNRKAKCFRGVDCKNSSCRFLHPKSDAEECLQGTNRRNQNVSPVDRTLLSPNGDRSENKLCSHVHPPTHTMFTAASFKPKLRLQPPEKPLSEVVELSGAECNFLELFDDKIMQTIRQEPGINDVKIKDGKIQLTGNSSAVANVKSYLKQALHEQSVTIKSALMKYLESTGKPSLVKRFLQKYRVGISSKKKFMARDVDQCEDDDDEDDNDNKSDISSVSSNVTTASSTPHNRTQNFIQVTLCSDLDDVLTKAIKELGNYSLYTQSWPLTQDEIAFILTHSRKDKTHPPKKMSYREQCFQIRHYLNDLVQSGPNSMIQIFIDNKHGVWHVKARGFKGHVKNAVSKIKNWLNDNVETEVQLPVSKVMAIFLRTKASSDIKKLEKAHFIKITSFSPFSRKHPKDEQDDIDHDCLKLTGSSSRIKSAQANVENFLESLCEQEKQFPCQSWDVSKSITQLICTRLKKFQDSDDCEAIGWIKFYTANERRDTTPKVTISIVGINEEAVDEVAEKYEDIAEGYVVWKPSADEFRAIFSALVVKKSPPIDEFRQQWDTDIRLDRDTSTVTIPARSKMIADEIKEALLSLGEEKKPQMQRLSEFIRIERKIHRFVHQTIRPLLDEAKSQKIFVESKNPDGLTLHGRSEIVTELKQKINSIIHEIQGQIITQRLQLSSIESNLIRANAYGLARRIERETNTVIRDVNADTLGSTLQANDNEGSSPLITVMNSRGQTIIVAKGDITKARNVDAIVNAANGPLYHAGGVDKAIADAAGPALDQECKQVIVKNKDLPLSPGNAVKTTAGNLPFKCVIHAIGPQYVDGNQQERPLLFSSIMKSLQLAEDEGYTSVALPAVSSKTYGFPLADCTSIVVRAVKQFFADFPQSKMKRIVLLDVDDTACNSFAREVAIDHSNAVLDNDDELIDYELPPLTAKWCWQDDGDEKMNTDTDIRKIEAAFQQYLKTSVPPDLKLDTDNLKSGTIVSYNIHFRPDLKQILTSNPSALNGRLVCGYQMRVNTGYKRYIIRYPVVVQQQQQNQGRPVKYHPKPLDSYNTQLVTADEYWNITGIVNAAVEQAQRAIRAAIQSATITESFSINLNRDFDSHKKELSKIATQEQVEIIFQEESHGQLPMILKGFKPNVTEIKLKFALYVQEILTLQVENDAELRIPKEWSNQSEDCKLVEISKTDPCFVRIENRMKETLTHVKIDKIERVQNVRMWNHYAFRRRELKKELRHMPNLQIEMELFHGTRNTLPSEVYNGEYGFDMTFSTSGMWGIGTYFAKNASYSCGSYAYQLPNGKRQVFLAQVLTGDVHKCNSDNSLRRPPKKNETVSCLRYNSVSGNTGGSDVYIVYENRVAYPTYLITFTQ